MATVQAAPLKVGDRVRTTFALGFPAGATGTVVKPDNGLIYLTVTVLLDARRFSHPLETFLAPHEIERIDDDRSDT